MSSPQQRTRDPQPLGRGAEIAFVVLSGVLVVLGLTALAGLGAASALAGGGWVWPTGGDSIGHVLAGLLAGEPGRGLPAELQDRVPGPVAVYSAVAAAELATVAASAAAGSVVWRYHRPGDSRRGMATRTEAAQILGRSRLRQARPIIRPDL